MNSSDNTSPELTELQEVGTAITRLVAGGNYVASFQCIELDNANNLDNAVAAINKYYSQSQLQTDDVTQFTEGWPTAWKEISECVWYGVDANDGNEPNRPRLSEEAIEQLRKHRERMEELLDKLIDEKAAIYTFGWSQRLKSWISLDDYVVFWSYRFIILNPDGSAYLVHGSSSD